jgi:hypothetical protein
METSARSYDDEGSKMKIDCSKYATTLNRLKHFVEKDKDITNSISKLSSASFCPVIACTILAIEIHGKTDILIRQYKSIISFYGYTEVLDFSGNIFYID